MTEGVHSRIRPEIIAEERDNLLKTDLTACYPAIRCPVLVLRAIQGMLSEDDLVLPQEALSGFAQDLPQARLIDLDGSNHFCSQRQKTRFSSRQHYD